MKESEKDRLASEVAELRTAFDLALLDKRKYPVQEFKAFVKTARSYIEMTAADPMIHKTVASAVNGLREFLEPRGGKEANSWRYLVRGRQVGVPALLWV